MNYYRKSYYYAKKASSLKGEADAYHNIGGCFSDIKKRDSAIVYYRKALALYEKTDDKEIEEILAYEFPASKLEAWPVNTIRTRKADDETVIEKVSDESFPAL